MMKKFFALSAAAVFFCMFTARGQELPEQGMNDPGMENNNAEMTKSADALFPYIPRLRTNIAKEDYKVSLEKLKSDKRARIAEYISQKENAKINLKLADGAKAAEIRDVVKLYKKEINSGETKRYINAFKTSRHRHMSCIRACWRRHYHRRKLNHSKQATSASIHFRCYALSRPLPRIGCIGCRS